MIEIALKEISDRSTPAVTSLHVAEHFGKENFNVLNDVRRTIDKCSESFNALNFQPVEYMDAKGETSTMFTGVHHV